MILLPAVLGIASTFILTWLKDLNTISRRSRILAEATQRIQFWKEWAALANSQKLTSSIDNGVLELELRRSAQLIRETYLFWPPPLTWTQSTYEAYLRHVRFLRRWFFLHAMPTPKLVEKRSDFRLALLLFTSTYLAAVFDPILIRVAHRHPASLIARNWLLQNASVEAYPRVWAVLLGGMTFVFLCAACWQWFLVFAGREEWLGDDRYARLSSALRKNIASN